MEHTNVPARWLLGGGGALALGSFLPWAEAGPFSVSGTSGDGVLTLILAVVIGIAAWPSVRTAIGPARTIAITIAVALALAICFYDIANISSGNDDFIDVQVGIGLWIAAGGAIAVVVGLILGRKREIVAFSGGRPAVIAATSAPVAAPAEGDSARWAPDPSGRHELRYWDGTEWTDHVSDAGVTGTDPFAAQP